MIGFAQRVWGFLNARSATFGRKRLTSIFVAWWAIFWAANGLWPCCDILVAAAPHGHSLHTTAAGHDTNHASGDHAPHPQCTTIGDIDMAAPNGASLLVAKLQLPDAVWLPAELMVPAPIRQIASLSHRLSQPPPPARLYLRTSRLLI